MKIYSVTTRRPAFKNCGNLVMGYRIFAGITTAKVWARKEHKKYEGSMIRVEELSLKDITKKVLSSAFENQDIMDLVEKRNTVKEYT